MNYSVFDGQQEEERILYTITAHSLSKTIAIIRIIILALFFVFVMFMIGSIVPQTAGTLHILGFICAIILVSAGYWWNTVVFAKDRTYITDRRIIRFDVVSPFLTTKRALFWNEVIKSKAYAPNLLYKTLHVGVIVVEPMMTDHENVVVTDVYLYEDVANYIDKILYTVKNKPEELRALRTFIPKPKGQRG